MDAVTWAARDVEMKRLQTSEIRLGAENTSLKHSIETTWPSWLVAGAALVAGFAAGYELHKL
jgi:hypothetical protein